MYVPTLQIVQHFFIIVEIRMKCYVFTRLCVWHYNKYL